MKKPFDSQFLSRIFLSDSKTEGRGGRQGRGRLIRVLARMVWRGLGWGGVGGGIRRDQSSPVLHVGGSERLLSTKLDKKCGAH